MSQSKLSDFFTAKKGSYHLQPSKRRKLNELTTFEAQNEEVKEPVVCSKRAKNLRPRTKLRLIDTRRKKQDNDPVAKGQATLKSFFQANSMENSNLKSQEECSASYDDHNASPPSTPTKTSISMQFKRVRQSKPQDLLVETFQTPERAFDFASSVNTKNNEVRKRLVLSPKTGRSVPTTQSKTVKVSTYNLSVNTLIKRLCNVYELFISRIWYMQFIAG